MNAFATRCWTLFLSLALGLGASVAVGQNTYGPMSSEPKAVHRPSNAPIYWGSHGLAIPYRWASTGDAQSATEVVLYVSSNRGTSWEKVTSAAPHVTSFLYQAPSDGEFWFAVRTYDQRGGFQPSGSLQPEMQVVVDTKSPAIARIEGKIKQGVCRLTVEANDDVAIDTAALKLYAQTDALSGWTLVPLTPVAGVRGSNKSVATIAQWRPPLGTKSISLRATVSDRAGNQAESSGQVVIPTLNEGLAIVGPRFGPRTTSNPYVADSSAVPALPLSGTKDPFDALGPSTPPTWGQQSTNSSLIVSDAVPVVRDSSAPSSWQSARSQTVDQPQALPPQSWPTDKAQSFALQPSRDMNRGPFDSHRSPFSNATFNSTDSNASLSRPFHNKPFHDEPAAHSPSQAIDRTVNSTSFEFDYDLQEIGQWGVANVELWGTRDDGKTWRRFAIDSDRQSPIHVSVSSEGVYGFRILVESVGGLAPSKPRRGDRPEVSVRVDLKRPHVVLTRVEQGQGYLGDQLTIDWQANEEHPADQPIDLYYSNHPDGPWAPIATSLDDSGRYAWRLLRHVPERLYVRLEMRDAAGNVGTATTPQPVSIHLPKPMGALRSVRPIGR